MGVCSLRSHGGSFVNCACQCPCCGKWQSKLVKDRAKVVLRCVFCGKNTKLLQSSPKGFAECFRVVRALGDVSVLVSKLNGRCLK